MPDRAGVPASDGAVQAHEYPEGDRWRTNARLWRLVAEAREEMYQRLVETIREMTNDQAGGQS